jgi:hypothetical protein
MSVLYEALRKLEEGSLMLIEKDVPPHKLGESDPSDEKTISLSPVFLVETLRDIKTLAQSTRSVFSQRRSLPIMKNIPVWP